MNVFSAVKNRLAGFLTRSARLVKVLERDHQKQINHDPYTPPWLKRMQHKYLRTVACNPTGCPKLTGVRLVRTVEACAAHHLTIARPVNVDA